MSFLSSAPPDLLRSALEISLVGFIVFWPLYDPAIIATITDLDYVHLNSAAPRMLAQPEGPAVSLLTLYPAPRETGVFTFCRDPFLAWALGHPDSN